MKRMESRERIQKYSHHQFLSSALDEGKKKGRQKAHENTIYNARDRLQKGKGKCS